MKNFGVYRYIALIFTLLVVSTAVWGQTYWIGGPGPASAANPANWSAGVPGAGDTAIIDSDAQIEIPGSGTIGTAIVDAGNTVEFIIQAGTLTVGTQLQNNGNLTISGPGNLTVSGTANTGTLTIGAGGARNLGPLTNDGTLAVGANTVTTGLISGGGLITVSTGTITATGTIANLETSDAATINLSGDITALTVVAGTPTLNGVVAGLTAGGNPGGDIITTGTVTLNGNTFTSITNSGALTFNNTADLSGDMNLTAGSLTLGGDISVGGNWTDSGATFAHNGNAVSFTPTGTSTITGNTTFYDLNCVNQGGDTLSIANTITVTNNLTLTGTDALNTLTVTGTGSIGLPGHQVSGEFLTVNPDIDITGGGMYTAYNSTASGAVPTSWYITAGAPGEFVWTGATSSNWHTGSNWDTGFAPVNATDDVEIVNVGFPPTVSAPVGIDNLIITSGTLTLNAALTVNALNNLDTIEITSTGSISDSDNDSGTFRYSTGGGTILSLDGYNNLEISDNTWAAGAGLTIAGTLSVTGSASAFFNNGAGGQTTTAGNVNITSSGTISLGNAAGDQFNCTTGGFTSDAPTTLFGQLTTNGQNITFNASLTIQGASAVSTGGGTGNIEFNNVLEGIVGNTDTLTLTAGAGYVLFDNTVGSGQQLGSITVSLASGGITANNTINAQTVSLTGGTVVLGDTVTAPGGFSSTGTGAASTFNNTGGTITTTDNNIAITHEGAITIGAELSSGAGDISVGAVAAGTITLSDATPVTTTGGNITFNRPVTLTVDAVISTGAVGGNIAFGANSSINGTFLLELEAGTGTVGLASTVGDTDPLTSLIVSSATTATLQENVTTSGTGIDVTATTINLRGLTMTAGTDPAAGITLTGSVALLDDAVSLEATDDISITGAVSGAQTLTINNANDVTFGDTITVANLVQSAGSGTTTFVQNVTTDDAAGIAINTTNIVLDGLTMTAGTAAAADIALTGTVTLSTADVVLSAQDEIAIGGIVDGGEDLTATSINNGTIEFTARIGGTTPLASLDVTGGNVTFGDAVTINGNVEITTNALLTTEEDADFNLTGSFLQNGTGENLLAGGVTTTGGSITFTGDVYLYGTAGDMTFSSTVDPVTFAEDLHIACEAKTVNLENPVEAENIVLYGGEIDFTDTSTRPGLTVTGDIVLLNGNPATMYDDSAAGQSGVTGLFRYDHPDRVGPPQRTAAPNATLATTFPGATPPLFPGNYTGSFNLANLPGKTLRVDGNFYANGVDLNPGAAWTLSIPDNDNALASFAEVYNLSLRFCNVVLNGAGSLPNLAAAEATDNGDNSTNCVFSRPVILVDDGFQTTGDPLSGTYTVYDNVIRVEFYDGSPGPLVPANLVAIENSNNEISAAIGNIRLDDGTIPFTGTWTNPECTNSTNGAGDRTYFYINVGPTGRWNTDATGGSAGHADSTDRSGVNSTNIPNIDIPKALIGVYQTLRDSAKNRIAHYQLAGIGRFTATADRCRPVLVQVSTGQELHTSVLTDQLPYDAHNFIELRYSEEVDIGGFDTRPINTGFTSIYEKSSTTFDGTTLFGGAITPAGAGLEIAGYIRTAGGTLETGTRGPHGAPAPNASDPTVHALYRDFSVDGDPMNFGFQPHRLRISIAGWCEPLAPSFFWQGFITNAVTPSGAVTVLENVDITDLAGNVLDHTHGLPGVNSTEADLYSDWDTTPPDFAALRTYTDNWNDPLSAYELNPLASPGGLVNRIEMHFYDNRIDYSNPSETWKWQSRTGWYENTTATIEHPAPENFGGARPDRQLTGPFPTQPTSGGIRDSSFHNASSAFVIDNSGPTATGSDITNFTTGVNSPFYNILATLNVVDDPYITLQLDDLALGWPIATASIQVTYTAWSNLTPTGGFITDLAGNLLGSQTNMQTLDRTPPEVTVSIAGANRDELYLVFSKNLDTLQLNAENGIRLELQDPADIVTATSVEMPGGSTRVLHFRLDSPITANQLINPASEIRFLDHPTQVLNPDTGALETVSWYRDTMGNYVSLAETHRITDIAVGLVEVLYASDGVNTDGIFGSNEGALRVFDGTGRLLDRNLTIATHLSNETAAPLALTMYYDASAPAASLPGLFNSATGLTSRLWLPGVQPGFNTQGNPAARALGPDQILDADRLFRNFAISEADEDMVPGSDIDILFRYGDLYCARLEDPADLSSVAPWTIGIAETKRQRGGVTILNNVIDSRRRERTIVQVEVPEAGNIVIQVFTLDGNVVKVLERGRKGAGTYQYFWDGTNNGGRPVARGMYFIRVVGPDIDEIRKVMVVKE